MTMVRVGHHVQTGPPDITCYDFLFFTCYSVFLAKTKNHSIAHGKGKFKNRKIMSEPPSGRNPWPPQPGIGGAGHGHLNPLPHLDESELARAIVAMCCLGREM